jgi:hypothetical protein
MGTVDTVTRPRLMFFEPAAGDIVVVLLWLGLLTPSACIWLAASVRIVSLTAQPCPAARAQVSCEAAAQRK